LELEAFEHISLHKLQQDRPTDDDANNRQYTEYKRNEYFNGRFGGKTFPAPKTHQAGIFG
jgi:hypothetical protein